MHHQAQVAHTPYELPSADNFTQQSGEPFRNYIRCVSGRRDMGERRGD